MGKIERILWIHHKLFGGKTLTAALGARHFEVSQKTIKRDVEYLRDRCEAPVQWNSSKRSYEYTENWDGLEFLDEHSLLAAAFFRAMLGQLSYIPVVADSLDEELLAHLPEDYRVVVDAIRYELPQFEPVPDALVSELCHAMRKRRRVYIVYTNSRDEKTERDIEPRRLVNYSGKWYVVAWDNHHNELRTFALSRVFSFTATTHPFLTDEETGASFSTVENFLNSSYGIYKGEATGMATLRFYGSAAINVRHTIWHPKQHVREFTDSAAVPIVELEVPVHDYPELLGRALRCGSNCEVLSPPEFRQLWQAEICAMAKRAEGP